MAMATRRERVVPRLIEEEMRESFLDYSMSVIVQRALPDVRDGLKPVHRRILYAMLQAGLAPTRPYKKSATVVGDVLGKYHPHGDSAVYDALVRMVQDFSLRYPLVDGQGNFGSVDGDNAAAYRYTEARLTPMAMELLADIDEETVDLTRNFDDRLDEPSVLPARFPNLLVNGSSGIAVGMATNIPPHNLREIAEAVRYLVKNPKCTVDDLLPLVPGPDFPTGAYIMGRGGIEDAYRTGRGRIVMRAVIQRETRRGGREQLIVSAIPYGVSKSKVIEQIANLARTKLEEIADLRDESDREGMRLIIELKRDASIQKVLTTLYRNTHLQATFGAIMLALDKGVPREFNLKEMLERFRDHRLEVIRRRSQWRLDRARAEAHILEGLLIALDNIDAVIRIIRKSKDQKEAATALQKKYELSVEQAEAILNMRLGRLTSLETQDLKKQLTALRKQIKELDALLASEKKQLAVVIEELDSIVDEFGDERRTRILDEETGELVQVEEVVAEEQVVITFSHRGYIKRVPLALHQRRLASGRAMAGMDRYEDDFLEHVFVASTTDVLVFFTDGGQAHAIEVHAVPEGGPQSRGRAIAQLVSLERGAKVAAMIAVGDFDQDRALVFLTAGGTVKRTTLDQFNNIRTGGIGAIKLQPKDTLLDVQLSDGAADVVIVTKQGRAIRFAESQVPPTGRVTQGVKGIGLRKGDGVVGMVVVRRDATVCTVTANGYAKRTPIGDYPAQNRGGLGTITLDVTDRTGPLVAVKELLDGDEVMLVAQDGTAIRLAAEDVPVQGRATQGKRLAKLDSKIVEVARVARESNDDGGSSRARSTSDGSRSTKGGRQLDLIE
ncbi:MAG: DNA gyrase subunit A [Longimicrobiales bacterium]